MRLSRLVPAATLVALALVLPTRSAGAQLGLGAGVTVPSGDYGDAAKNGWVVSPFFEIKLPGPFGLRLSGLWTRSDLDQGFVEDLPTPPSSDQVTGDVNLIGGGLDGTLNITAIPVVKPYIIGGIGWYRQSVEQSVEGVGNEIADIDESSTDVGYNIGLGLKIPVAFVNLFVEGRYYSMQTIREQNFAPIILGVSLGR